MKKLLGCHKLTANILPKIISVPEIITYFYLYIKIQIVINIKVPIAIFS